MSWVVAGWLLGGCYAVSGCSEWFPCGYYAIAWVFWVIPSVLLGGTYAAMQLFGVVAVARVLLVLSGGC